MPGKRYPLIAREAWFYIGLSAFVAIAVSYFLGYLLAIPFWVLLAILLYLFRDPFREVPSSPLAIVGPVDARVIAIEECNDPYLERPAIRITLDMNTFGIYSIRSPIEGKVQQLWFKPPKKANEQLQDGGIQYSSWIQTDEQDDVVMVMSSKSKSSAPRCYIQSGERVGQGQRCGFARFGVKVVLYIPANSRIEVKPGDHLHAGSDILAMLVHKD